MSDAWGTVTALAGEHAMVRMDDNNGCGRCGEPGGCGGNHLGKMLCRTPSTVLALNPECCGVGARVRVRVGEGALGRSALNAYAWPCLALIAGAVAGSAIGGEAVAIGGAIVGLLVGWLGLRRAQRHAMHDARLQPSIRP